MEQWRGGWHELSSEILPSARDRRVTPYIKNRAAGRDEPSSYGGGGVEAEENAIGINRGKERAIEIRRPCWGTMVRAHSRGGIRLSGYPVITNSPDI